MNGPASSLHTSVMKASCSHKLHAHACTCLFFDIHVKIPIAECTHSACTACSIHTYFFRANMTSLASSPSALLGSLCCMTALCDIAEILPLIIHAVVGAPDCLTILFCIHVPCVTHMELYSCSIVHY